MKEKKINSNDNNFSFYKYIVRSSINDLTKKKKKSLKRE
jgi:hypothetical protein